MPHNLYTDPVSGQISMMYAGDTPWHRLGKKLEQPATSKEAIQAAGLDWLVDKYPLKVKTPTTYQTVENQFVIMRKDLWQQDKPGPYFGIVSGGYQLLQNHEAFEFFDDVVGQKAAIYHTAGALGNGERVWILAKLPESIRVVGDDICDKYLLLSNSHDGKSSVQMKFTPIRVVCQNTLTLSLRRGPTIHISHTRNLRTRMRQAEDLLGIIHNQFEIIEADLKRMASVNMNTEKIAAYYKILFPDPRDPGDELGLERIKRNRVNAERYFESGRGNTEKGVSRTLWAAYNGVAEMVDYPSTTTNLDQHLKSIWFGDGYLLKARAFQVGMENIKAWAG